MSRSYYNRYDDFFIDGQFRIVPGIEIPIRRSDKYITYKKGRTRLDKISDEIYGTPVFGWLILQANPLAGSIEFQIPDNFIIRVPFPLNNALQEYKSAIELYKLYYGES